MAMVINTNLASLNAQRSLSGSANKLSTSMERLSSGLRINSAKDDAAGLAISSRMTAQITGLNVAQRNANDGVSLAQTAEGAMASISNNLQRIRELAVQSSNATNSNDDRAALQKEVNQLTAEIDRVATSTKFNNTSLLDGTFTAQNFQVGANKGETIQVASITSMKLEDLVGGGTPKYDYATGAAPTIADPKAALSFTIGGKSVSVATADPRTEAEALAALKSAFETTVAANSELAGFTMDATGKISGAGVGANNIAIASQTGISGLTLGAATEAAAATTVDISDATKAADAIESMDTALKAVNSARADLGAIQNRFESVVSNLATTAENLTASRSRILDADFAVETANLSSAQVLQQAGTAMVAQANQLPQNVLSLLR